MTLSKSLCDNPRVVYCRLSKSAGNSVVTCMKESCFQFGDTIEHFNGSVGDFQHRVENSPENVTAFQLEWWFPENLDRIGSMPKMEVFTCLRNPWRRFESEFFSRKKELYFKQGGDFVSVNNSTFKCSTWMNTALYRKNNDDYLPVCINRPNYYVRMLCGLSQHPEIELTEEHLERAKRVLDSFIGVIILEDIESYSLIRRWNYHGKLVRQGIDRIRRDDTFLDMESEEFKEMNSLDMSIFQYAKLLTQQRLQQERLDAAVHVCKRQPSQDYVMSKTDIVVPIKQPGIFLRTVLESLEEFYQPRRIIVVSSIQTKEWFENKIDRSCWKIRDNVEVVLEDLLWAPLDITRDDLEKAYNNIALPTSSLKPREFGWWYQQIIKLGVGLMLPDISENYYVWDADLIPLRRWKLGDIVDGKEKYYTAVLQYASRGGNAAEYIKCLDDCVGIPLSTPAGSGGTFISHHMAMNKTTCKNILDTIVAQCSGPEFSQEFDTQGKWPLVILSISRFHTRFSEYAIYASWKNHVGETTIGEEPFQYHDFAKFGRGGIRMRDGDSFVPALIKGVDAHDPKLVNGYSYDEIRQFAADYFKNENTIPPYIQLDHVFTDIAATPTNTWMYHESYTFGTLFLPKTLEEAKLAHDKLVKRKKLWWDRFKDSGCIFIHVPKNAGTSIERLYAFDEPDQKPQSQHFTAMELRDDDYKSFVSLYKFAIVRNPYDRLLSAYNYLRNGGNKQKTDMAWKKHIEDLGSFQDFCEHYFGDSQPVDWSSNILPSHMVPQYMFLCDEQMEVLVDSFIDVNDLSFTGLHVLRKHNTKKVNFSCQVPRLRQSTYSKEISYNQRTADLVYAAYAHDFELLPWHSKDSWKKPGNEKKVEIPAVAQVFDVETKASETAIPEQAPTGLLPVVPAL